MSLSNPTSTIRLYNVPWSKGDGNLKLFTSIAEQTTQMLDYSSNNSYIGNNYNIIRNNVIKLPVNQYEIQKYNYMMFKNPDISSNREWWYAFIDRIEWLSANSCAVYYTIDAWQCYQHQIKYKKCYVERTHVPVSTDTPGNWLAPEPIGVTPQIEKKIDAFDDLDWSPQWVLHSTSKPVKDSNNKLTYEYSGTGNNASLTAEYGRYVNTTADIKKVVSEYGKASLDDIINASTTQDSDAVFNIKQIIYDILTQQQPITHDIQDSLSAVSSAFSLADFQDHRNELIGLYAIPKWLKNAHSVDPDWATNTIQQRSVTITLTPNTLACGYTPRNKKMLTSMCKGYSIYTANGFKCAFKPELFTSNKPTITLYGSQMATDGYLMQIKNYGNKSDSYHKLAYACQSRLGYDANTGLDKDLNILSTAVNTMGTIGSIATGNPIGILYGTSNIAKAGVDMIDAIGQRGVNTGSSGNLISITDDRPIPQVVDVSPNTAECEYIDNYLDVYGYSIDEIQTPNINVRPSWTYIKVAKLNAEIKAPDEYAQSIINAFQNGCHIWSPSVAINNVGNFGLNNR